MAVGPVRSAEPGEPPLPKGAVARLVPAPGEFEQASGSDGPGEVQYLSFSPDGRRLAVGYYSSHPVVIFDTTTGKEVVRAGKVTGDAGLLGGGRYALPIAGSRGLAFVNGGKEVWSAWSSGAFAHWDAATGRPLSHTLYFRPVRFAPVEDGKRMLVHSIWEGLPGAHFLVVDPGTRKQTRVVGKYDKRVDGFALSPDGKRLVAYDWTARTASLWDYAAGREVGNLAGHRQGVYGARFTPDSKHVVTASRDTAIRVWLAADGKLVRTIGQPRWLDDPDVHFPMSLAVSPKSRFMAATGDSRGDVTVWDIVAGKEQLRLKAGTNGHQNRVWAIEFSPNGRYLATGGAEGAVMIWDLAAFGLIPL